MRPRVRNLNIQLAIFHYCLSENVSDNCIVSIHFDQWLGSVRSYAKHLRIDGVKNTIAIASGKGGVGKSTTAGKTTLQSFSCLLLITIK